MKSWKALVPATLILCACAGGVGGYAVGVQRSNVSVLTAAFYVGDHQASGAVDGWTYGVTDSVPWLDSNNSWHDDGWPACLGPVGATRTVRFGYTSVDGPTPITWRQVVWVSCRS